MAGLQDAPGRGRKPRLSPKALGRALGLARLSPVSAAILRTLQGPPCGARLQIERAPALVGPSAAAHRGARKFKLSKDLQFEEKFWDVVGLYLNPPAQV